MIVGIRPEFASVAGKDDPRQIRIDLELVETLGSEALLHASLGGDPFVIRTDTLGKLAMLDTVTGFTVEPELIKVFDGRTGRHAGRTGAPVMSTELDHGAPATEELALLASEAKRSRQSVLLERIVDHLRREWQLYVLVAPTIIWLLVFLYKPMYGLQIAFKDYSIFRGVANSPWIGLEHFQTLFGNDQFLRALKNTVLISFYSLIFGFPMPILLALMFNEILKPKPSRRPPRQSSICRISSRR